jgi:hypothetical protein
MTHSIMAFSTTMKKCNTHQWFLTFFVTLFFNKQASQLNPSFSIFNIKTCEIFGNYVFWVPCWDTEQRESGKAILYLQIIIIILINYIIIKLSIKMRTIPAETGNGTSLGTLFCFKFFLIPFLVNFFDNLISFNKNKIFLHCILRLWSR